MVTSTATAAGSSRGSIHVVLWVVQGLLAALFLFAGVMKFAMPLDQMEKQSNLPGWFLLFIGAAEIVGAAGLILPGLLKIRPVLTPIAAMGLFIIMLGAIHETFPMGLAATILPGATALLTAFVAYGRLRLAPIPERK